MKQKAWISPFAYENEILFPVSSLAAVLKPNADFSCSQIRWMTPSSTVHLVTALRNPGRGGQGTISERFACGKGRAFRPSEENRCDHTSFYQEQQGAENRDPGGWSTIAPGTYLTQCGPTTSMRGTSTTNWQRRLADDRDTSIQINT